MIYRILSILPALLMITACSKEPQEPPKADRYLTMYYLDKPSNKVIRVKAYELNRAKGDWRLVEASK